VTEPSGTYVVCPLEGCEWKLRTDETRTSFRIDITNGVDAGIQDLVRREAQAREHAIREHLDDHDPLDFLRTIAALRQRLGQYERVPDMVVSHWPGKERR
jgi:hypothetical protein